MTRRFFSFLFAAPLALGLAACATDADTNGDAPEQAQLLDATVAVVDAGTSSSDAATPSGAFTLTSPVIKPGVRIAQKHRCDPPTNGQSPALQWTKGPSGTKSYAVVLQDEVNKYFHWVIYDIPASESGLPEGLPRAAALDAPKGAKQSKNYVRTYQGYGGPCYPISEASAKDRPYALTLYAIDVDALPGVTAQSQAADVVRAIEAHDLASTKLPVTSIGP